MSLPQNLKNAGKKILNQIYFPFLIKPAIRLFQTARLNVTTPAEAQALSENFYYGPKFRPLQINLRAAQQKDEIIKLMTAVKNLAPKIVLEIGTATGGTLFFWTQMAPPDALIISLDLPFGHFGAGYISSKIKLYQSLARGEQKIELLRVDSHRATTKEKLAALLAGRKIDFLFIDGDHSYLGAKQDFDDYKEFVRPGGLIALHDIARTSAESESKVEILWDEIKNQYPSEEYINDDQQGWAGIGVIHFNN